ncbi:hypothetical protein L1887_05884 [Cichorium endivia]|nr:hypothetical protein L1887_05884 [Cichorium endivia]
MFPHPPHVDHVPLQQYPPENHLTCRPLSAAPSFCSSSNVAVSYRNCTASVQLLPPGIRSFLLYGFTQCPHHQIDDIEVVFIGAITGLWIGGISKLGFKKQCWHRLKSYRM